MSDGSPGNWGLGLLLTVKRPRPELIAGSGDRNWAELFTARPCPHSQEVVYATSGRRAQAICSFNQAAVLMDLISLAVMKAAPPP